MAIRLVITEDNPLVRESVERLLELTSPQLVGVRKTAFVPAPGVLWQAALVVCA